MGNCKAIFGKVKSLNENRVNGSQGFVNYGEQYTDACVPSRKRTDKNHLSRIARQSTLDKRESRAAAARKNFKPTHIVEVLYRAFAIAKNGGSVFKHHYFN